MLTTILCIASLFLLSKEAQWITAHAMPVDAGVSIETLSNEPGLIEVPPDDRRRNSPYSINHYVLLKLCVL